MFSVIFLIRVKKWLLLLILDNANDSISYQIHEKIFHSASFKNYNIFKSEEIFYRLIFSVIFQILVKKGWLFIIMIGQRGCLFLYQINVKIFNSVSFKKCNIFQSEKRLYTVKFLVLFCLILVKKDYCYY